MRSLENKPFTLQGRGGAALFVHGLGGGPVEVQWLAEDVAARTGLTVRATQLPGHTAPSRRMPASKQEDWVATVIEEVRSLRGGGPVHVIGFSTGATIALRVAELGEVDGKVALLAPFVDIHPPRLLPVRPEVLLDLFSGLHEVPRRGARLHDKALQKEVNQKLPFATMNLDAARSAKTLCDVVMRDLGKIKVPVLLLQGQKDGVVDARGAERIATWLNTEARLVRLPKSDHLVSLDVERDQVFDEVVNFLRAGE